MSGILDAIGLLGTALGVISFATSHLPGTGPSGTAVQVKIGQRNDISGEGGGVSDMFGFDLQNGYIGKSGGGSDSAGGVIRNVLDQANPDRQADYLDVTFTNDDICVAWISVRMHDGSPGGAWTGDVGSLCGQPWHKSNPAAGRKKNGDIYRPRCTWFDADHTRGKSGGLKFKTRAYGEAAQRAVKDGKQCAYTAFSRDNSVIEGKPGKRDIAINDMPRPEWIEKKLIVSEHPDDVDGAAELCNSDNSWGSDFLAHGMFCDMGTKTLYPLCESQNTVGCVELTNGTISIRNPVQARDSHSPFKDYHHTDLWTEESSLE